MTGNITSLPPAIQPPASSTTGNPEVLGPLSYVPAIPNLPQNWIAVQTFAAGTLVLQGTGAASNVVVQETLNGPVTVRRLAFSDISGTIGPVQLPAATPSTLGGVFSKASASHQFLTQIGTDGSISAAQPSVSDISGGAALTGNNDTNVTISFGGAPASALLAATSITLGWSGTLAASRGGFGADISAQSGVPLFATGVPTFTGTTGSGNFVRATSPTLVTPVLGTPSSGTLTNCTGLPLAGLASQAANTIVGNVTGSSASPTAFTIDGLTLKASPASTDEVIIWDVAGAAIKKATVSGIGSSSGVTSLNTKTGAISLSVITQVFSASGTYTPTSGMVYCIIECWGGGGAGGSTAGTAGGFTGGGGGGAGSKSIKSASAATVGASQTVTIGAAGSPGAAGNNPGGNGGDTSVGTLCIGKGGTGGGGGTTSSIGAGGAGGIAGTGDITGTGAPGLHASVAASVTTFNAPSGMGGSSEFGGGGQPAINAAGNAATGFASGGGGSQNFNGSANTAGGAGKGGLVRITEFVIS